MVGASYKVLPPFLLIVNSLVLIILLSDLFVVEPEFVNGGVRSGLGRVKTVSDVRRILEV